MKILKSVLGLGLLAMAVAIVSASEAKADGGPLSIATYRGVFGDSQLELTLDFSSGRPIIIGGEVCQELESAQIQPDASGTDFSARICGAQPLGHLVRPEQTAPQRELDVEFAGEFLTLTFAQQ